MAASWASGATVAAAHGLAALVPGAVTVIGSYIAIRRFAEYVSRAPELCAGPGPGAADLESHHSLCRAAQCRHLGLHAVGLLERQQSPSGVGEERAWRSGLVVSQLPNG